ncbi:uncharacterized protein EDB93DRAFT_491446 [Suillus bovinus]|uniref:uncharacterized protein n=1 Tax=Suillus bovinus TaxID=48563 RepID=UPI001B87F29F|nr:uncharacterized protein EDB93DRAFT_491446 [Suillus bovinus]KAG2124844.1 hypothetical protein EDB93DRAFT_491446 [Suillus bovinus]
MMPRISPQHGPLKINIVFALSLVLPLIISFLNPAWRFAQFTPRQLIYGTDLLPFITAFWASPTHTFGHLSRFLQAAIVACFPQALPIHMITFWAIIALARTLSGFLLCRSVGWTYPWLFSHWALYETSSGIGPALTAYLIMHGAWPWSNSRLQKYCTDTMKSLAIICSCLTLCWLDSAPWTYAMASIASVVLWPVQAINTSSSQYHPYSYYPTAWDTRRLRTVIQTAVLFLFLMLSVHVILTTMVSSKMSLDMSTSQGTHPFLEILILPYPRPNDAASTESLLSQTISSYVPYIDSNTILSVFTHSTAHVSFAHAKEYYAQTPITFYTDTDIHIDSYSGQHLHVAEAFRWASEKGPSQAEWVMLVEDDFPVCGEWGWQGILNVMNELQRGGKYGGFVGTGGSGLIIHRSLLPILTYIMRIHALQHSPIPPSVQYRPADIIIQDCLWGRDLLCPHNSKEPVLVITSRLVMDHIGGSASTMRGRVYPADRWKCGWRHPFHGLTQVDVVPVWYDENLFSNVMLEC